MVFTVVVVHVFDVVIVVVVPRNLHSKVGQNRFIDRRDVVVVVGH